MIWNLKNDLRSKKKGILCFGHFPSENYVCDNWVCTRESQHAMVTNRKAKRWGIRPVHPHIRVHMICFQTFFMWAFKIVIDSWKFSMLLLYLLWDDWPIFMISGSNEQLQQQLEYTLLNPDCHSWWISKMQSGRLDTLEERYAIKFCFRLGKNATETYGMLQTAFQPSCMNQASAFECHKRFKEGRESVRDDEKCGRTKEVNTPQLIGQRVRVRVTMLRF